MTSRLPKPKFTLKRAITTVDMSVKSNNEKVTKCQDDLVATSSNNFQKDMKNAQSMNNIHLKEIKENKLPNPGVVRAKTVASITRPAMALRGTKRPGPTTNATEAKKPNVKPAPKIITSRAVKPTTKTNTIANAKTATSEAAKSAPVPKPSKWDLKGRLAYTTDELNSTKERYKELITKHKELQEQLDALEGNENAYKSKMDKLEEENVKMIDELQIVKEQMSKLREERDDLSKRLKETEDSYEITAEMLKKCRERCNAQSVELKEQTAEVKTLQSDVEKQRKIIEDLSTTKEALQTLVHKMDKDRRILHNAIQEMKGNIRVFCRVRPRTPREATKGLCTINFVDECTIEVGKSDGSDAISCSGKSRGIRQEFSFDKVFPPTASQEDVFEELSLLVQSALEGYNVCVFAYGQTGSGKTYTMEGMPGLEMEGMIPRTVRHIFKEMKQFELLGWEYRIEASFLEIYNEHIVDLLDSQPKTHEIKMVDSKGTDLYVSNLQIQEIHSPEELHECLLTAQRNRAVAATQANERSSRSHSVTRIRLIGTHTRKEEVSVGNLNLVDLAGSERLKADEAARMAETKNINKSLANLGNVILALLKKQEHIPYRNSKLTHMLMPSLGGNSKTLMLLNISPLDECYNETLNSLRFASSVNSCKTGTVRRTRTVLQNTT